LGGERLSGGHRWEERGRSERRRRYRLEGCLVGRGASGHGLGLGGEEDRHRKEGRGWKRGGMATMGAHLWWRSDGRVGSEVDDSLGVGLTVLRW